MSDVVIRVENISKLYRLGEVGTGSLAHDVNRWWHRVRGKEDPYLKIGEVNDRTRPAKAAGAKELEDRRSKLETAEGGGEGTAGGNQRADSGEFLEGHSQAGLQMDSEKLAAIRSANASSASGARSTLDARRSTPQSSAKISEICGQPSSSALDARRSTLDSPIICENQRNLRTTIFLCPRLCAEGSAFERRSHSPTQKAHRQAK
jgi:hypothetical protein